MNVSTHHIPMSGVELAGRIVRAVASLLFFVVALVGWPWALWRYGEWLIDSVPSWQQVQDLPHTITEDHVVYGIISLACWIIWAAFATSFLVEVVARVRGRRGGDVGPLGLLQQPIRAMLASLAISVGSSNMTTAALATMPTAVVVAEQPYTAPVAAGNATGVDGQADVNADKPDIEWRTITVAEGDSAWSIAEQHYGRGQNWQLLWHDNQHRRQPDSSSWDEPTRVLRAGWTLRLREEHITPAQLSASPQLQTPPAAAAPPGDMITVQPGDSFWSIAEQRLAAQWGRTPSNAEIAGYWQLLVDVNRDRLTPPQDPDLIYPGQQFEAPLVPATPGTTDAPQPPPTPPPAEDAAPAPPETSVDVDEQHEPAPPAAQPTPNERTGESPTSSETPTSTDRPVEQPDQDQPPSTSAPGRDRSEADNITKIGVGAALATLTLGLIAHRRMSRRRSTRPDTAPETRPAEQIEVERSLAETTDDSLDRAWQVSRILAAATKTLDSPPVVTGIVLHPDGATTVHLAEPVLPTGPFVDDPDDPLIWLLPATEDASSAPPEAETPMMETLVTLGTTPDGASIWVDLESLGAASIEGDDLAADTLLRSIAADLSLQTVDRLAHVAVVGVQAVAGTDRGSVHDHLDEAQVHVAERAAAEMTSYLAGENISSTLSGRQRGLPRDGLAAFVAVIGQGADPVLVERLTRAALPGGLGLAVVTRQPAEAGGIELHVDAEGTLHVPHLGLTARAAHLDDRDADLISQLLKAEPETPAAAPTETPAQTTASPSTFDDYHEPDWQYCVGVFADLQVVKRSGEELSFRYGDNPDVPNKNTNRGPELLAYLALRPDRSASLDNIREDLWWSRQISSATAQTLVTSTRTMLGGPEHLSRANGGNGHQRYQLADTVTTDVERIEQALAYAHGVADTDPATAVEALHNHLEHVEAPPFREGELGQGLIEWATANGIVTRVERAIVDLALLAADLHMKTDDPQVDRAIWAIGQGLRACPINEPLVRRAMELTAQTGDRHIADQHYQALAAHLSRNDLEPEPETTALRRHLMSPKDRIG